jgi:hypothetical protein
MLDELLVAGKINKDEYDDYLLFAMNDRGRQWLDRRIMEAFMDEPSPEHCVGEAFAYTVGRGGILRGIRSSIEKVNYLLKERENDRPKDAEPQ